MDILQKYIEKINAEILKTEREIASRERRLSRLREKLRAPEISFAEEQGKGSMRVKEVSGQQVNKRKNLNLKSKLERDESLDLKKSVEVAPAAPAPANNEKRSSWSFLK